LLKNQLGLQEPTHRTLLAIEATQNLRGIQRGDLLLVDREQTGLIVGFFGSESSFCQSAVLRV